MIILYKKDDITDTVVYSQLHRQIHIMFEQSSRIKTNMPGQIKLLGHTTISQGHLSIQTLGYHTPPKYTTRVLEPYKVLIVV